MFSKKRKRKMVEISRLENGSPEFKLDQNTPNPFSKQTTICLSIAQAGAVKLVVYNLHEDPVATLYKGTLDAGTYNMSWDSRDNTGSFLKPGDYVYRLEAGGFVASRKLVITNK